MPRPVFQNPHLDGSTFLLPGSSTGILLFHGFTATTVEIRPLAECLNQAGYTIKAPLIPGHGTRPEDMLKVHWRDWVSCADKAFTELTNQCENVVVAGESMGGLLSLHLASRHADIRGVMLYAPALKIDGIWKAYLMAPFKKIVPKGYIKDDDEEELFPWQGYNVLPLPAVIQLNRLQKVVTKKLRKVHQPLLVMQGELDRTINPNSSRIIINEVSSSQKELIWLKRSGHCVVLDREFEEVKRASLEFLRGLSL